METPEDHRRKEFVCSRAIFRECLLKVFHLIFCGFMLFWTVGNVLCCVKFLGCLLKIFTI